VAVVTALTATPTGSLYLSTAGKLWFFDGADTATPSTTGLILLSAATETADATEYIGI